MTVAVATITQLSAGTTLDGTEEFPSWQSSATVKSTLLQAKTYVVAAMIAQANTYTGLQTFLAPASGAIALAIKGRVTGDASVINIYKNDGTTLQAYIQIDNSGVVFDVYQNIPWILQTSNTTRLTVSGAGLFTVWDGGNFALGGTTGTKWGTSTSDKQGWWNATPVVQPTAVTDASGGATIDAEARTALNALLARMRTIGLIAT